MKSILIILIVFARLPFLMAQEISASDSVEISNKIDDWNNAWTIKDVNLACKWYSEDADFTNAFGFNKTGQSEIHSYLSFVFGLDFVMAGNTKQTSLKLKSISEKAILAISTVERAGQKTADNKDLGIRNTTHYRVFQKMGEWKITAHLISDARSIASEGH